MHRATFLPLLTGYSNRFKAWLLLVHVVPPHIRLYHSRVHHETGDDRRACSLTVRSPCVACARREYLNADLALVQCFVCFKYGHLCCGPRPAADTEHSCYNCGARGHLGPHCPQPAKVRAEVEPRRRQLSVTKLQARLFTP